PHTPFQLDKGFLPSLRSRHLIHVLRSTEELIQMDLPSILAPISGEDPLILPSAHRERKHGEQPIADSDILHVYRYGIEADINVLRFPPTHVLVGTGASGAILYEIGVIEREWIPGTYEHVIVHAMRARLTYEMKWLTMQYQDGDNDEI
ncbi:hypothetical protein, partial [Bifidobacterium longum]|uniref:hypothetical protein n=3 Tax=Bifidobacterium longum TaxID=216816 RepID=UPI0022464E94